MFDKRVYKIAAFLAERLEERNVRVAQIILFGSQSRGDTHKDSDVDLAVISEDFHGKGIFKRMDMIGQADANTVLEFHVPIDVILMSPDDLEHGTSLMSDYVKMGKVIFPRSSVRKPKQKAG